MDDRKIAKFKGRLDRQMFPKNNQPYADGGFAILTFTDIEVLEGELEINRKYGTVTVKGCYPYYIKDITETHKITCEIIQDPKWGKQNKLMMIHTDLDIKSIESQKIFLKAAGVTDSQIGQLYDKLDNPMETIKNGDTDTLCGLKGIGKKTAENMIKKFRSNEDYSEVFIELSALGMTPHMIKKLSDSYGSPKILMKKIKQNPYVLTDIDGVGFKKADAIALASGVDRMSQERLIAFIKHILKEGGQQGYSWIFSSTLIDRIESEIGNFSMNAINEAVQLLKKKKIVWNEEQGKIGLQSFYKLEQKIREELMRIKEGENNFNFIGWEERVRQAEEQQGWKYTQEQKEAIKAVLENQLIVITGKGGTGKSSTALGAIKALGKASFGQCCLSGKGAARLKEVTGYEAYTIHRLLGYSPGFSKESDFQHNSKQPLPLDVVLLDEFAMVGGSLFLDLLKAIPTGSKLILLGDPAQLPAIGSLNIGNDLTLSPHVKTASLTEIHRQAKKSAIITDSIRLSEGVQIIDKDFTGKELRGELKDLEMDIYLNKEDTVQKIIHHFKEKLAICNDINEIQVIVPLSMRGEACVYSLNKLLQPLYNPYKSDKKEILLPLSKDKTYTLRVGDKVINTKNNYKMTVVDKYNKDIEGIGIVYSKKWMSYEVGIEEETGKIIYDQVPVFNGFIGEIIDIINEGLVINFPLVGKTVLVDVNHWCTEKAIHLAYALTCHKMQGSSVEYCICAIDYSHYVMLGREMIYTMLTRASKHCTLIAENKALRYATRNTVTQDKQTHLQKLLDEHYN